MKMLDSVLPRLVRVNVATKDIAPYLFSMRERGEEDALSLSGTKSKDDETLDKKIREYEIASFHTCLLQSHHIISCDRITCFTISSKM